MRTTASHQIPLLVLLAVFLLGTLPLLTRGTESLRLLSSLSSDEPYVVEIARCMMRQGTVSVASCAGYLPDWPRLYFYLCLGASYPALAIFPPTATTIAVACRSVTLVFGLLSVAATYLLALRMFGRRVAFLAGLLFLATGLFLKWSLTIHPDVPQLFFVTLGLLFAYRVARSGRWRDILLAAAFAALGFSTKYAGAFVLPAIGLGIAAYLCVALRPRSVVSWMGWAGHVALKTATALLVFVGVYALTTPELITSPADVIRGFFDGANQISTQGPGGSILRGQIDPQEWLATLTSGSVLGLLCILLVAVLAIGSGVRLAMKGPSARIDRGHWVIGASAVLFVAFLLSYVTYVGAIPCTSDCAGSLRFCDVCASLALE